MVRNGDQRGRGGGGAEAEESLFSLAHFSWRLLTI